MRISTLFLLSALCFGSSLAHARKDREVGPVMTVQEAIDDAERALDSGRIGDAIEEAARLQKSRGLNKEELKRLELIIARCGLVQGNYSASEKTFAKLHKATPDNTRLAEWYARALDGAGKGDAAFALLTKLADSDQLQEGDSYWALAQLDLQKGDSLKARQHAELALKKPILLQSDELDQEIHSFIKKLSGKKSDVSAPAKIERGRK